MRVLENVEKKRVEAEKKKKKYVVGTADGIRVAKGLREKGIE